MRHGSARRWVTGWMPVITALACAAMATAGPMAEPPPVLLPFDIPAGPATETLHEYSRQAMVQLLYDYDLINGRRTRPIRGTFRREEALARMLERSGLKFEFVNNRAVAVTPIRRPAPPARKKAAQPDPIQRVSVEPVQAPEEIAEVEILASPFELPPPVGQQVLSFSRVDIDRSGVPTVAEFLQTLPQNFEGGPTQDTITSKNSEGNSGMGTGLNLRGLGSGATLVLLNGRRIAPSGVEARFADILNIPLSAIERVDILPDSASTLYGSDAMGGVVNLILRKNYSGQETRARVGGAAHSSLREQSYSQLVGLDAASGHGFLSLEFYKRDALPAADRERATSDLRPFGGDNFNTPFGNPGTIVIGNQAWRIPEGQDGTSLTPKDLLLEPSVMHDRLKGADIMPTQRLMSAYGTWTQSLRDDLNLFADILYNKRTARASAGGFMMPIIVPSTHPFYVNPTGGTEPIVVMYNFLDDLGPVRFDTTVTTANLSLGVDWAITNGWRLSANGGHAFEKEHLKPSGRVDLNALEIALADPNPATVFNPFGDGSHTNPATLDAITDKAALFKSDSRYDQINVTASGPLGQTTAGPMRLTLGGEYRHQFFEDVTQEAIVVLPALKLDRDITSVFGELGVPLVSRKNRRPVTERLELSVGVRFEDYSDIGRGLTPKLGLLWEPLPGLSLRSTWSKSFKAPTLPHLAATRNFSEIIQVIDPSSETGVTNVLVWTGKNAELRAERGESWTIGADFTLSSHPGLGVALTYFDVHVTDQILEPSLSVNVLDDPALTGLINRTPTEAERAAVCARSMYVARGSIVADCMEGPVGAIADLRLQNFAQVRTRGIDVVAKYDRHFSGGTLDIDLIGTYLFEYARAKSPQSPLLDFVNTARFPLSRRLRAIASWAFRDLEISAVVHHAGSYRDISSQPNRRVGSWTTFDLQLTYDTGRRGHIWLDDLRLSIRTQNVFDRMPPFFNNPIGIGYDQENGDLLGRMVSVSLHKKW